jgi:beta-galactosidase GanA
MTASRPALSGLALALVALTGAAPATAADETLAPHLRKQGTATQLMVDGRPFLALSGELGNNSATSLDHVRPIWAQLVEGNLNSVLVAVSWAMVEPEEGGFDFSLVDGLIQEARNHRLRLVLLWFGSWKNGLSSYVPDWVKRDYERFPRIRINDGETLELLSTLAPASRDADAAAFAAFMRHLREVDGQDHTVVMVQIENEVGVLGDTRDRSDAANEAFRGPVPGALMDHIQQHDGHLVPELQEAWEAQGRKLAGSWEEVFGPGKPEDLRIPVRTLSPPLTPEEHKTAWRSVHFYTDELFMAWHYARYIGAMATAGKAEYPLPMFVNAWLQQRDHAWPGTYPSGGPSPQVLDVWRAAAPAIDILAPDLYAPEFDWWCQRYTRSGNPLFIPETRGGEAGAARVFLAVGQYDAIGFSPFFVERQTGAESPLARSYGHLAQMSHLILAHQGQGTMGAVLLDDDLEEQSVRVGDYTIKAERKTSSFFGSRKVDNAYGLFIAIGPSEYVVAGHGIIVRFEPNTPGPALAGLATVEEGTFSDGRWVPGRRLAGDDTDQGVNLRFLQPQIQRVTLYRYE